MCWTADIRMCMRAAVHSGRPGTCWIFPLQSWQGAGTHRILQQRTSQLDITPARVKRNVECIVTWAYTAYCTAVHVTTKLSMQGKLESMATQGNEMDTTE